MNEVEGEFERTRQYLDKLFSKPVEDRRPRYTKTLALREEPLRILHLQQVELLRQWRSEGGDLPRELILSVSAVASGLRTTG